MILAKDQRIVLKQKSFFLQIKKIIFKIVLMSQTPKRESNLQNPIFYFYSTQFQIYRILTNKFLKLVYINKLAQDLYHLSFFTSNSIKVYFLIDEYQRQNQLLVTKKSCRINQTFPKTCHFSNKKTLITAPPVVSVRQPQQPLKIDVTEKSQLQEPKKQKEHKKVDQISSKKTQNIAYPLPIKQQLTQKMKRQENPAQNQDKIISVKANINKFNNLSIPILGQNVQSCIVGSFKKRQAPKVQNEIKNESQALLAQSMPLHGAQEKEQHQLTFKQKLLMAQKAFANRNGQFLLAKKVIEEPKQNQQVQKDENTTNSQQIVSTEVKCETNDKEKNENEQSDKLFQQSMKQQAQKQTLLVGGQINNLTLQTRMTRRVKRKNDEDDFDDL